MPTEQKNAPKRCEMCDEKLPTWADREKHMEETNHCRCWKCGEYLPPGGTYAHLGNAHNDEPWNEHMAAWSDREDLEKAMPWVREEHEKAQKRWNTQLKASKKSKKQTEGKDGEEEDTKP